MLLRRLVLTVVFEWLVGWLLGLRSWLLLDMVWASIHFSADRFALQLEMMEMGYGAGSVAVVWVCIYGRSWSWVGLDISGYLFAKQEGR